MKKLILKKIWLISLLLAGYPDQTELKEAPKSGKIPGETKPAVTPKRQNQFLINGEWKRWRDRFASASPLLVLNKTWPKAMTITDENNLQILQRKSTIKFAEPLKDRDRIVESIDVTEFADAVRFEVQDQIDLQLKQIPADQALKEEERFKRMLEFMSEMIGKRAPDELIIQFVGATHAIDLFFDFFLKDSDKKKLLPFLTRRDEVVFTAAPYQMETSFETPERHQLMEVADGIPSKVTTFGDSSYAFATMFLSRLYYYQNLLRGRLKLENLKHDEAFLGTIVIMDVHRLNQAEHIESLPSAQALRAAGINRVKLGNEGWKFGTSYSLEQLRRSALTPAQGRLADHEVALLKEKSPQWHEKYLNGIVVDRAAYATYLKLKSWADAGISVSITGLEEFENIGK